MLRAGSPHCRGQSLVRERQPLVESRYRHGLPQRIVVSHSGWWHIRLSKRPMFARNQTGTLVLFSDGMRHMVISDATATFVRMLFAEDTTE